MRGLKQAVWLTIFLLSAPTAMFGQQSPPPERTGPSISQALPIVYNFAPPGARSLGMGGSFIALSDDATASESNPAGLTILTRPEVSLHGRSSSYEIEADDVEGAKVINFVDVIRDQARAIEPSIPDFLPQDSRVTFDDSESSASFASYVQPWRRAVFSLYYIENANFSGSSAVNIDDDIFFDFWQTSIQNRTQLRSIGASVAFKLGGRVSAGLSVRRSELSVDSLQERRVDYFRDFEFERGNANFADVIDIRKRADGKDDDLTFNAGILFALNEKLSFGLIYKDGGQYSIDTTDTSLDCITLDRLTCDSVRRPGNRYVFLESRSITEFTLPDVIGAGIAWRPNERLTVALDVNRISYSDLNPQIDTGEFPAGVVEEIDDQTALHLGAEYTFLLRGGQTPFLVRAGLFTDPDHDIYARVDSDRTHLTLGAGIVVLRNLQVDLAGDLSDEADTALLSAVYRF